MRNMLHLRPVNGSRVLDPDAVPVPEALPVAGKMVADTPYWRRRLKAREVELVPEAGTSGAESGKAASLGEKAGTAKGK